MPLHFSDEETDLLRSATKLRRTRSPAGWWSVACRVVTGALLRRLTPRRLALAVGGGLGVGLAGQTGVIDAAELAVEIGAAH
jgi:hypothetical protein